MSEPVNNNLNNNEDGTQGSGNQVLENL